MENDIINKLWDNVEQTIKLMNRSDRVYSIDKEKSALIIIDMQFCFCSPEGAIEIPNSRKIVPNINKLLSLCREKNIPIIWLNKVHKSDMSTIGLWKHFQPKSPVSRDRQDPINALSIESRESKIWKELDVDTNKDYFVNKTRYSGFMGENSELNNLLKKLRKDTLFITGVGTNVCCESTARDAMMLNYKVIVVNDATATVEDLFHEISLMNIKMFFGDVVNTNTLLSEISS